MLENTTDLRDIRKVKINTDLPVAERIISFVNQAGNPYLFKAGETVVEVEFTGNRSFSAAMANLFSGKYFH